MTVAAKKIQPTHPVGSGGAAAGSLEAGGVGVGATWPVGACPGDACCGIEAPMFVSDMTNSNQWTDGASLVRWAPVRLILDG
jgi:hypothetical protein